MVYLRKCFIHNKAPEATAYVASGACCCFGLFGAVWTNGLQAWYRPGHSPDRWAFCLVFGILRLAFSLHIGILSGIPDTVLGIRPTKECFVWCSAFFALRSVDRSTFSRVFRIPSWAFARQKSVLSGVRHSSPFVQSTDRLSLGCSEYRPGRSPDR